MQQSTGLCYSVTVDTITSMNKSFPMNREALLFYTSSTEFLEDKNRTGIIARH